MAVVPSVCRAFCSRERWVVRLWGSPSVTSICRHHRGSVARLGLWWWLPVVQVSVWRWLWRFRWPLVWGQDGHSSYLGHWRHWAGLWRLFDLRR